MPASKSTRKQKRKTKRVNWKKSAIALARCVVFTLKFDKHLGRGSGQMVELKTGKSQPWQEPFFDALDGIGYLIDRDAYYRSKEHKRRSR